MRLFFIIFAVFLLASCTPSIYGETFARNAIIRDIVAKS